MAAKCFPGHECVIAIHTDKPHIHAHIIVNAVSFEDGKKLRIPTSEYTRMKDLANEVGLAHGFSPIDFRKPSKDKVKSREKQLLLRGGVGWKDELKNVIAAAKQESPSFESFAEYLQKYGVTIERNTAQTISFKHPEKKKPIRGDSLGEDFTKEVIIRAINEYANRATARAEESTTPTTIQPAITHQQPPAVILERAVESVGRAITSGVGKHNAQTDIDRIHGTIRGIKNTAKQFSPTSRKPLSAGQKDTGNNSKPHSAVERKAQPQPKPKCRGYDR